MKIGGRIWSKTVHEYLWLATSETTVGFYICEGGGGLEKRKRGQREGETEGQRSGEREREGKGGEVGRGNRYHKGAC